MLKRKSVIVFAAISCTVIGAIFITTIAKAADEGALMKSVFVVVFLMLSPVYVALTSLKGALLALAVSGLCVGLSAISIAKLNGIFLFIAMIVLTVLWFNFGVIISSYFIAV